MSRRNPPSKVPEPHRVTITVCCTDRGEHPRAVLGKIETDYQGESQVIEISGSRREETLNRQRWNQERQRFICPRCGRDLQMRTHKLIWAAFKIESGARGSDDVVRKGLDISYAHLLT